MFWRKRDRIEALEKQLHESEVEIQSRKDTIDCLKYEIDELKKKISGERVCDGYCTVCQNSYKYSDRHGNVKCDCILNCKCSDFKEKEIIRW